MKNNKDIMRGGIIAALYVVLTMLSSALGLSSGAVQLRLSEMLCVLPCFTASAVPGLFLGCLLANTLTGCVPVDIVFGSLATLLGAWGTRRMRRRPRLALLPPIVFNTITVPLLMRYAYGIKGAFLFFAITAGAGEILSAGVLGYCLYKTIARQPRLMELL